MTTENTESRASQIATAAILMIGALLFPLFGPSMQGANKVWFIAGLSFVLVALTSFQFMHLRHDGKKTLAGARANRHPVAGDTRGATSRHRSLPGQIANGKTGIVAFGADNHGAARLRKARPASGLWQSRRFQVSGKGRQGNIPGTITRKSLAGLLCIHPLHRALPASLRHPGPVTGTTQKPTPCADCYLHRGPGPRQPKGT